MNDFRVLFDIKRIELETQKIQLPKYVAENKILKKKVEQLESELEIVNWYLTILEKGIDTQKIVEEYDNLQKSYNKMENDLRQKIKVLTEENNHKKKKLVEA